MTSQTHPVEKYLRMDRIPHIWCPGCGIGTTVNCFTRALEESRIGLDKVFIVSGIGCSSRFPYYMNTYGIHSIHGRAPTLATGLKIANPDLNVWVITGDGDGLSIGGNHLLHCLRRNVDMNIILFNKRHFTVYLCKLRLSVGS